MSNYIGLVNNLVYAMEYSEAIIIITSMHGYCHEDKLSTCNWNKPIIKLEII